MGYMIEPAPELVRIKNVCRQIIEKYINPQAQDNIANRAAEIIRKKAEGNTLTSDETTFLDNQTLMNTYIKTMQDHCVTLVGNENYADESQWPVCPPDVESFGQDN